MVVLFCAALALISPTSDKSGERPPAPELVLPVSPDIIPPRAVPEIASADKRPESLRPAPDIAGDEAGTLVVIDKASHSMEVLQGGRVVRKYGIAVGKNSGDKQRVGDMRTPEGEFPIVQIQNSSGWTHDFRDGKGQIQGAYGPYFIRLGTPGWTGIGIHGTHAPNSIGTDVTEGCIRLNNSDVAELRKMVKIGDKVVIKR
ncbi:MAG: L,D-transpeptidase [Synergistaceae bacterium]|nr:L,D-transpeptidase [Synergistaceae bacterium]